jgi:hypothetical protein
MGLLKRLVVAIEKIADRGDDYSELGRLLNNAMLVQSDIQMKLRMMERKENMRDRYHWLKSKQKQGKQMEDSELYEIEIGKEMFESDGEKKV